MRVGAGVPSVTFPVGSGVVCLFGSTSLFTLLRCFLSSFVAKRDDGAHKSELGMF